MSAPSIVTPSDPGTLTVGCTEAARDDGPAVLIEQRQFAILRELEDEVLENSILLPWLRGRSAEGRRPQP